LLIIVEQDEPIRVVCRDGIPAVVQKVKYEGVQGGFCMFGHRVHPLVPEFDRNGMRNESGDIWYKDGFWLDSGDIHPFDIVAQLTQHFNPQIATSHG
jgi:hypothetical protein